MADVFLRRTLSGFVPDQASDFDAIKAFKVNETYRASIHKPRNLRNHRRWWALCNLIYQNSEQYRSIDQVSDHLKILAGHCTSIASKRTGEIYMIPDSIAFSRLDEAQFQDVFGRAMNAVVEHVLPGIEIDDVAHEIEKLCGVAA